MPVTRKRAGGAPRLPSPDFQRATTVDRDESANTRRGDPAVKKTAHSSEERRRRGGIRSPSDLKTTTTTVRRRAKREARKQPVVGLFADYARPRQKRRTRRRCREAVESEVDRATGGGERARISRGVDRAERPLGNLSGDRKSVYTMRLIVDVWWKKKIDGSPKEARGLQNQPLPIILISFM